MQYNCTDLSLSYFVHRTMLSVARRDKAFLFFRKKLAAA